MKLNEINYDLTNAKEIEILDPNTKQSFEKPAFISLYSLESKKGKQCQMNIFRDILEFKSKKEELSEEQEQEIVIKHISKLVAGWRGIEDEKGKEIKYSESKALELLQKYDIIYNIVDTEVGKLGNFLNQ